MLQNYLTIVNYLPDFTFCYYNSTYELKRQNLYKYRIQI